MEVSGFAEEGMEGSKKKKKKARYCGVLIYDCNIISFGFKQEDAEIRQKQSVKVDRRLAIRIDSLVAQLPLNLFALVQYTLCTGLAGEYCAE